MSCDNHVAPARCIMFPRMLSAATCHASSKCCPSTRCNADVNMDKSWQCTVWALRSGAATGRWTVNVGGRATAVPNQKGASQIDSTWSARGWRDCLPKTDHSTTSTTAFSTSLLHRRQSLHRPTPLVYGTPLVSAIESPRAPRRGLLRSSPPEPNLGCPTSLRRKRPCSADHHLAGLPGSRSPPTCAHLCGVAASGPRSPPNCAHLCGVGGVGATLSADGGVGNVGPNSAKISAHIGTSNGLSPMTPCHSWRTRYIRDDQAHGPTRQRPQDMAGENEWEWEGSRRS